MREPSHSLFKGAGLDRPVLTGLTQTTTRENNKNSSSAHISEMNEVDTLGDAVTQLIPFAL